MTTQQTDPIQATVGTSHRISVTDLLHLDEGAVSAGATVTIWIYDQAGAEVQQETATVAADPEEGAENDWFADVLMPATPGRYEIKAQASKSGAIWRGSVGLQVNRW